MSPSDFRELSAPIIKRDLELHGVATVRVSGTSMHPLLRRGTTLRLRPYQRKPRVGDIVAVEHADLVAIHRVTHIVDGKIVTRGDASRESDPEVQPSAVLARAEEMQTHSGIWLPVPSGRRVAWLARTLGRLSRAVRRRVS